MKFPLSLLLWIITFAAVILGAYGWIQRNETRAQAEIQKAKDDAAAKIAESESFNQKVMQQVRMEFGKSAYFRRQLGVIENSESMTTPYVKYVRMPAELGGKQHHGLPFTWQWRILLPNANAVELCWATNNIPLDDRYDLPAASIHRSPLGITNNPNQSGVLYSNLEVPDAIKNHKGPLEVIVYFRLEANSEGGTVFVNYELSLPGPTRIGRVVSRGSKSRLSAEEANWLQDCSTSRGGYSITGMSVDRDSIKIPLLDNPFAADSKTLLLKARSRKQLSPVKFEPFKGPCPGLLIWLEPTTGSSTESGPESIKIQLPKSVVDESSEQ